jgi:hypothetical protein
MYPQYNNNKTMEKINKTPTATLQKKPSSLYSMISFIVK